MAKVKSMASASIALPELDRQDLWQLSAADLTEALRTAELLRNRAEAAQAAVLAEIGSRGVFATYGYPSLVGLQRDLLRIGRTEAKKRARRAAVLHPSREGAGERTAVAPLTAQAAAEGALNPGQVDAIGDVMTAVPAAVTETDRAGYEKTLVDLGRKAEPAVVRRAGRHLLAVLDPDGTEPDDDELAEPERELLWSWTRNNRCTLKATLDAEAGQLLETLLSALAKPRQNVDGMPDRRSAGQRQGDAFAELLEYTSAPPSVPPRQGRHRW